ncbi:MAG: DUF1638 domain-containing protein [Eubacteriaceae bacterium]
MKSIIISCNTIRAEVDLMIGKTGCDYPVIYLESGLHNYPEKLSAVLQENLNRISNVDQVLLVMGYCGNAVVGLKPEGFKLIIPRADDCITMLLGSQNIRKEVQEEKYTYFLSKGWIDMFEDIEKTMVDELERMEKRYGKAKGKKIWKMAFKHYERLGVIDIGEFNLEEMMENAKEKAELMDLECEVIPGTTKLLEKVLTGPWDENKFLIIKSGETVSTKQVLV